MTSASAVSIAMATYNGEAFLSAQLQSLASQTVMPAELVIADDGSSDRTVSIIEQFARTSHFSVRLNVNKERLGYKRNFMSAAERCKSDLIAFCDQDDIWYSTKIAEVSSCMADEAVSLCFHDYDLVGPDDHRLRAHQQSQSSVIRHDSISSSLGMAQTFRRSLLRFMPLFDLSRDENCPNEVMAHDQWIHFLARCDGTIQHIPRALLGYRQHDNNVSGQAHRNPKMDRLPNNPVILAARLRGQSQAFEKKRNLLLADLQRQQFFVGSQDRTDPSPRPVAERSRSRGTA